MFRYDRIAHMEGDDMSSAAKELSATSHIDPSFIATGWGKSGDEPFLQTNTVFHQTGASESWRKYYSLKEYPGIFDRVVQAHNEDIVRFGYSADIERMRQELEADANA
jgi:hypothetical protein